jgi:DNA-binding CsgD family transcriptional regulator
MDGVDGMSRVDAARSAYEDAEAVAKPPDTTLQGSIALLGANATSLRAFREQVLERIREDVRFDAALFHALSPRVPLETAAIVDLGRLRELALTTDGVVTDRQAFPAKSAGRARFDVEIGKKLGVRALAMAHLVVRGSIRSAVLLFRKKDGPFSNEDIARLRLVTPTLAIADALQVALDGAPRAALPVRMKCADQRLTARQRDIVEHVALGHTNTAIATALGLSPNTLRNHLAEVFHRLGAANRADVVRLAVLRPDP